MAGLIQIALGVLLVAVIGKAQIPKPCANEDIISSKECCPIPLALGSNAGSCGKNLSPPRGACVDIQQRHYRDSVNNSDPRQNWPFFYFNRTCNCTSNYGGYDCGECAFGYRGSNCNQTSPLRSRRSINSLSPAEWRKYISQLQMAKSDTDSRYRVIVSQPGEPLRIESVGVYNLFAWIHHYVAKDNEFDGTDYAHEATGFPTWHRLFLLWFEREMQDLLQDENFTVHYWDWRYPDQRTSLFKRGQLGARYNDTNSTVVGDLFNGWETVCWSKNRDGVPTPSNSICDPTKMTGPLQRCPDKDKCDPDYAGWPNDTDVSVALEKSQYDNKNYDPTATESFRNYMEGFKVVDNCNVSDERVRDLCNVKKGCSLQRLLHNTIHIILGFGHLGEPKYNKKNIGVMGDVAASANDPIFINHHTMIDCILEEWLRRHDDPTYPNAGGINMGHRQNDYIVPFIPLYTHNMMFKRAEDFGYSCNIPNSQSTAQPPPATEPDSAKSSTALLHLLVLAMLGIVALIL